MINWEQQFTEEFIIKLLGQQPLPQPTTQEEQQNESTEQD